MSVSVSVPRVVLCCRYKNWTLNDYLFLRSKRVHVSRRVKNVARSLRSLLPDLSWRQIQRDSGTIIATVVVVGSIVGTGVFLSHFWPEGTKYVGRRCF